MYSRGAMRTHGPSIDVTFHELLLRATLAPRRLALLQARPGRTHERRRSYLTRRRTIPRVDGTSPYVSRDPTAL